MDNGLAIVERLNKDHEGIRGYINVIISELKDWKDSNLDLSQIPAAGIENLNQKYINIRQVAGYLEEGLRRHWEIEEEKLPALIGMPLMEALKIEHQEISQRLKDVNGILINSSLKDFSENLDHLHSLLTHLCNLISEHETKENTILQLLKKRFV